MRSPGLQAGPSVEDNHYFLPQVPGLLFLSFAQALARRHHQYDRNDSPGNAKHGEKCTQLVRPQRTQHIVKEISQGHSASRMVGRDEKGKVSPRLAFCTLSRYVRSKQIVAGKCCHSPKNSIFHVDKSRWLYSALSAAVLRVLRDSSFTSSNRRPGHPVVKLPQCQLTLQPVPLLAVADFLLQSRQEIESDIGWLESLGVGMSDIMRERSKRGSPRRRHNLTPKRERRRMHPRQQSGCDRLHVTFHAANLPGKQNSWLRFHLQRVPQQRRRIDVSIAM